MEHTLALKKHRKIGQKEIFESNSLADLVMHSEDDLSPHEYLLEQHNSR